MERYTLAIKQENEYEITESGIINGSISGLGDNITIAQYEIQPQQQIHHGTMMLQHPQIIIHQQRIPQHHIHHQQQQHHIQQLQHITPSSTPNHLQHHTIQIHNEEESNGSNSILYTNNTHSQCTTPHIQIQIHRADGSRPNSVQHIPAELVQVSSPLQIHSPHYHNNQHQQIIIHQPVNTILEELQPQELEIAHQEEIITIPAQIMHKVEYPELSMTPQHQEQQYLPQDNININIVCKVCKENFVGVGNFTEHMKTHMPHEHVYEEDVMGATRIEMVDLSETLNIDKSAYPCAFCNKKYIWHKFLVTHSKCHKTPAPFLCTICGQNYDCLYYDHMKTHILSEGRTCSKCNENFTTLKALKNHVRTVHNPHLSGDANHQHKCNICGKHYKALSYLKEHERTHTGEKPYKCDVCGKAFAKYGCWAEHKKTHSIVKAFKCPMCPKAFTKRRYLKAHLLRHPKTLDLDKIFVEDRDGELPSRKFLFAPNKPKPVPKVQPKLECPICYKEFKKMRYLRSHVIRHPEDFVRQKLGLKPGMPIPPLLPAVLNRKSAMLAVPDSNQQELTNIQLETKLEMSSEDDSTDDEILGEEEEDAVGLEKGELKSDIEYPDNDLFNNDEFNDDEEFEENTVKQQIPSPEEINNITPHDISSNNVEIIDINIKPTVEEISPNLPEPAAEPTIFCCSICQKSYNQAKLLRDHEQVHYGENPYKCNYCNTVFVMWARYEDHMTFEHNDYSVHSDAEEEKKLKNLNHYCNTEEKSFTCRTCEDTFLTENMLEEHEDMHLGEEPLICRVCSEHFAIQIKYVDHLKGHGIEDESFENANEEESEAEDVKSENEVEIKRENNQSQHNGHEGRVLRSRVKKSKSSNLRNHRIRRLRRTTRKIIKKEEDSDHDEQSSDDHEKEKELREEDQDEDTDEIEMEVKEAVKETSKKRFKCKICGKLYTTLFYLKEHLSIHSGKRPHKCDTCGKTFAASSCYREHLEVHITGKNHKCDVCGMTFAVARYLKAHMRRHAQKTLPDGGKKYNCMQCEKKYQSKTALVEHVKIHTGEAPFKCTYCSKVFMLTSSFRDHMLKHENVEMHQCPFCPKSFIKARYLQQHLVRHIQKLDTEDDLAANSKKNEAKVQIDQEFEDSTSSSNHTDSEDEFFKTPPPEVSQTLV